MGEVRKVWADGKLIEVETLDIGLTSAPKRARNPRRYTQFPWIWTEVLSEARASGTTFAVATVLLYEAWKKVSRGYKPVVKLTDVMLKKVHVGEKGKRAALLKLEQLKLVGVARRANKNPNVTVYFFEWLPLPPEGSYPFHRKGVTPSVG
jgi:hypothetical protein